MPLVRGTFLSYAIRRCFWGLIAAGCFFGTLLFNAAFLRVQPATLQAVITATNTQPPADVLEIYRGYRASGTPFAASWWTGPWIHTNPRVHQSYRPLSSLLLWLETDLALRQGFRANGWVGVCLWAIASFMAALFCWRLTRDRWCVLGLILLLPLFRRFELGVPADFLWWYPLHPDILFAAFAFGVLVAFDAYLETRRSTLLLPVFFGFAFALGLKESAVIVPLLCLTLSVWRRTGTTEAKPVRSPWGKDAAIPGAMIALSLLFLAYRRHVLTHPYGPNVRDTTQVFHGIAYYLSASWSSDLNSDFWWIPALCCLIVSEGFLLSRLKVVSGCRWRRYALLTGAFVLPFLFIQCATEDLFSSLIVLIDAPIKIMHELTMLLDAALLFVAAPRWRHSPALLSLSLLFLVTAPVWCFLGWHYMVVPWFFRGVLYVCFTRLALERWAGYRSMQLSSVPPHAITARIYP